MTKTIDNYIKDKSATRYRSKKRRHLSPPAVNYAPYQQGCTPTRSRIKVNSNMTFRLQRKRRLKVSPMPNISNKSQRRLQLMISNGFGHNVFDSGLDDNLDSSQLDHSRAPSGTLHKAGSMP